MADIVVFDKTKPNEKTSRQSGMALLGRLYNQHFQNAGLTDQEVVNRTIQDIINNHPDFKVTYKHPDNVLRIKNAEKGKYWYIPGDTVAILKLRASKDKRIRDDNEVVDVMNIAVAEGNANLLAGDNYLTKVIDDLDAPFSQERQQYLLGTITFRRCR